MKTTSDMVIEHVELLKELKTATINQEDYIKLLEMSNTQLSSKIDVLKQGFNDIFESILKITH